MKKQLTHILFTVLVLALTVGCIRTDRSDCPPLGRNVTLRFRYLDGDGVDRFQSRHKSVVVAVFDETDACIYTRSISQSELERFQGDRLELGAGTYRVVCWGNVIERSQLFPAPLGETTLFPQAYLTLETKTPKQSSDPVMYAPRPAALTRGLEPGDVFRVTVDEDGEQVEETIDFVSAHTEFGVVVQGLVDMDNGVNVAPIVKVTTLPAGYDFSMNVRGGTEEYEKTSEYVNTSNGPEARATLYSGNFKENDPVTVLLYSGVDGRLLKTVYIPQYIIDNNIDFSDMLERWIKIIFEDIGNGSGTDIKVTVTFSAWVGENVTPGW